MFNPAIIAKALKMNELRKQFQPQAIKVFEAVQESATHDGFVYVFQAKFKTEAEAKAFKEFAAFSADIEKMLNEA